MVILYYILPCASGHKFNKVDGSKPTPPLLLSQADVSQLASLAHTNTHTEVDRIVLWTGHLLVHNSLIACVSACLQPWVHVLFIGLTD